MCPRGRQEVDVSTPAFTIQEGMKIFGADGKLNNPRYGGATLYLLLEWSGMDRCRLLPVFLIIGSGRHRSKMRG
jgi:hypothetical protein